MADTEEELRAYARKIKLPMSWIQDAGTDRVHFDVTGAKLRQVMADSTVQKMTLREWVDWRKRVQHDGTNEVSPHHDADRCARV